MCVYCNNRKYKMNYAESVTYTYVLVYSRNKFKMCFAGAQQVFDSMHFWILYLNFDLRNIILCLFSIICLELENLITALFS